ncbi:MAG: hypothetical protein WA231_07635, partial [Methylocella sp.]
MAAPKGHAKFGGRVKGVPNKVTGDLRAAILHAFDKVGGAKAMTPHSAANLSPAAHAKAPTSTPVARLICVRTTMYVRNLRAVSSVADKSFFAASGPMMACAFRRLVPRRVAEAPIADFAGWIAKAL